MVNKPLSDQALQRLERLVALRDQGALSEAEFQEQKASVLASAPGSEALRKPAADAEGPRSDLGGAKPVVDDPKPRRSRIGLWASAAAAGLLTIAAFTLWGGPDPVPPPSTGSATAPPPPASAAVRSPPPSEAKPPRPVDPAAEMRASGWEESSPDGDGCMMERRGQRNSGLNFVFIYSGEGKRTYELSFTSTLHRTDDVTTLTAQNAPDLEVAVLLDDHRVPAILQNHFGEFWEVEIPLSTTNRARIARAETIALQLGSEVIAREAIRPNPTSAAAIERCLDP